MTPEIIALILTYGIKYGPAIGRDVASLFSGEPVTVAQVVAVLNKAEKSADDYLAEARAKMIAEGIAAAIDTAPALPAGTVLKVQ